MNILIIGGAGFLGSNLVRRCLQEPSARIIVMDALDSRLHATTHHLKTIWNQIDFVHADLRNDSLLNELVQGQDLIFNCAAQTSHLLSIQHPVLDAEINCLGNLKLLEAVKAYCPKAVVVYVSSTTLTGKATQDVVDENHSEKPLEIYSANKGVAEKYYRIYNALHGVKTVILRFANLYGPYGKGYPEFGFVNYFISLALRNETIQVFGNGTQMRNLTYVEEAADLLWRAAQEPCLQGEVYLATSDYYLSVKQIAETIISVFQSGQVAYVEWPNDRQKTEIDDMKFSSARLRNLIDWHPKIDFRRGLEKIKQILEREPS